jgi:hypothetical protein
MKIFTVNEKKSGGETYSILRLYSIYIALLYPKTIVSIVYKPFYPKNGVEPNSVLRLESITLYMLN